MALLYVLLPYATGYGSERVNILEFANYIWKGGEDWEHCYLVPIAICVVLYFQRATFANLPVQGSFLGLVAITGALLIYWFGFRADNVYLGYASLQLLVGGLILWLLGWQWMKALAFPWAFLVFLYPLPFMDNFVAFPLRLIMSEASIHVLNFIGIPSVKSGTAILSAADPMSGLKMGQRFSLDVADPCSGIRSLFALMMVTALYAYLTQKGFARKLILFLCSIPLAVIGNLFRILMLTIGTLAMGSEWAIGSEEHPSFFHMMAGYAVFAVALGGMLGIGALLNLKWADHYHRIKDTINTSKLPPPPSASADPSVPAGKKTKERRQDEY